MVTHRLARIENADCIYVMQNGIVAEEGTYPELIMNDGLFHQIIRTGGNAEG